MKYLFKILILLTAVICSSNVIAEQCASITLMPSDYVGKETVLVLSGHNGLKTDSLVKKSELDGLTSEGYTYYLEPGVHALQIDTWGKSHFVKYQRALRNLLEMGGAPRTNSESHLRKTESNIWLTVKAGGHYTLTATTGKLSTSIVERLHSVTNCPEQKQHLYRAKAAPKVIEAQIFPKNLEYRLRYVMFKLSQHDRLDNYLPMKDATYSGVTFATADNIDGINVLSSLPYSLAGKLTLASGDKIIALGNKKLSGVIDSPEQEFINYLGSIEYGQKLKLTILRNGNIHYLSLDYLPNFIPESSYSISPKNQPNSFLVREEKKLTNYSNSLAFEYEQLLLQLEAFYHQDKKHEVNNVSIVREQGESPFLGFGLKNTKSGGGIVTNVITDSQGDKMGLLKDDIIVALNNINLEQKSAREIAEQFINIDRTNHLTVKVIRAGKKVTLTSSGPIVRLPSFVLNIDLLSSNKAKRSILAAIKDGTNSFEQTLRTYDFRIRSYNARPLKPHRMASSDSFK